MATRMQQRRGTAEQWTAANPVLAAGEIGFETDTNQFKMGDGANAWSALSYFKNLEDLGGSLDDYVPVALVGEPEGVASLDALGRVPISQLANLITDAPSVLDTMGELADFATMLDTQMTAHEQKTADVHGIANVADLATKTYATDAAASAAEGAETGAKTYADGIVAGASDIAAGALASHNGDTTDIHGITNTANLAYTQDLVDHNDATTDVHGIANTADLATKTYADTAVSTHNGDTTDIHGISNTANLVYATDLNTHNLDTTDVHGIADTAALATKTYADSSVSTAVAALTKSSVGLTNVDNTADVDKPVSTATQTALDLKAPKANPTFTGTVSGITKSMVGLENVDNTSDANKPVSTATQTALDLKAPKAAPTFTGTLTAADVTISGNLTVSGTTTTVNTANFTTADPLIYLGEGNNANLVDVGFVGSYNDGTYAHQGLVKDSSDGKWKLFKGVTDEPTTTVNFAQGSLDALKVGALEATTVTPSSGIVFSDGTQVKVGVPSITAFATAISSSATLAAGEQDKFVPLTGAVTITLPATGYSTGQSIDFYQASGTGAQFASTNSVVGTPGLKFRTTNSVVTAMKTSSGWLVFGDLSA